MKGLHERSDLDDASEGCVGELQPPQGAMETGEQMMVSRFDSKNKLGHNGQWSSERDQV